MSQATGEYILDRAYVMSKGLVSKIGKSKIYCNGSSVDHHLVTYLNTSKYLQVTDSVPQQCLEDVSILSSQYMWNLLTPILAPPQPSPAELKAQEEEAALTVQRVITWSILLYLCKLYSPLLLSYSC